MGEFAIREADAVLEATDAETQRSNTKGVIAGPKESVGDLSAASFSFSAGVSQREPELPVFFEIYMGESVRDIRRISDGRLIAVSTGEEQNGSFVAVRAIRDQGKLELDPAFEVKASGTGGSVIIGNTGNVFLVTNAERDWITQYEVQADGFKVISTFTMPEGRAVDAVVISRNDTAMRVRDDQGRIYEQRLSARGVVELGIAA